jgi:hypothetical protein
VTDILFSLPWACGNKDCKAQWHRATYWIDTEGFSLDNYSDGDHTSIEEADLPQADEIDAAWREYARDVLRSGKDPLGEYLVKGFVPVRQRWQFRLDAAPNGVRVMAARHAGRGYSWGQLPEHVKTFMHISGGPRLRDFADWAELVRIVPGVKPRCWYTFNIPHNKKRDPAVVTRELKRVARRALKNLSAG